jgi:hypothetical protein
MQRLTNDAASVVSHLKPLGRMDGTQHLHLAISLPLRNQQALADLLGQLQNPASPNYRKYLTPAQFGAKFGPTEKDYEAVADFANAHGLTVIARHPNRVILDVDGAVADIEKTLHVTMQIYQHPREARQFHAPDQDPTLTGLPVTVLHISGLDDYAMAHPNLHMKPAALGQKAIPSSGSGLGGTYVANDFRAAYVPGTSLTGSGQSVGLLEFDGYYPADISQYDSDWHAGAVPLVNVPVDGGISTPGSNTGEVSLDIEMAMSMAPGLTAIYVYEEPNGDPWIDILNRMANDDLASQMSCSWGGGTSGDPAAEQIFQQMAAQGQTFFQASGDSDAYTTALPFPCDSPNITVVGATTLTTTGAGGSYVSETVWNWGGGVGSSGGSSTFYTIPPWQQSVSMINNQGSIYFRNVPDVAMVGDNVFVFYGDGLDGSFGGTSCAAPLWAAFTALVNQQAAANGQGAVGFINPAIYSIGAEPGYTSDFNDVTAGNNFNASSPSLYSAAAGYDLCTGWGSPAGTPLINALAGPADPLRISYSFFGATGTSGGPFTPNSQTYALADSGAQPIPWTASATQNWLTLSSTGGIIAASGSSTLIASLNSKVKALPVGTYSDTITFTDVATGVQQSRLVSVVVTVPAAILIVNPSSAFASDGYAGGPFNPPSGALLVTNSGNVPMTWSLSNTTSWLTASPAGGTLEAGGTASVTASFTAAANSLTTGTYNDAFVFTNLTNGVGNISIPATLTILPPPPVITSSTIATGTQGQAFSYQIVASNSPTSYGATGLPAGLSINTTSGLISGTPVGSGVSNVNISASNSGGAGTATVMLTVLASIPVITSQTSVAAAVNYPFTYWITASNLPTAFNATGLPPGLSVNTTSGLISGTPTTTGTSHLTISATNPAGSGTAPLVLAIAPITSPATAFYFYSSSSAIVGAGESWLYSLIVTIVESDNFIEVRVPKTSTINGWIVFLAMPGSQTFTTGTYTGAYRFLTGPSNAPGLELEYVGTAGQAGSHFPGSLTGNFVVYALTASNGLVSSLAADFIQYDQGITDDWNIGSIRYNSTVPVTYASPPSITGLSVTGSATNSAVLDATVNPDGLPATCYIQYGPTTSYGYTSGIQSLPNNILGEPASVTLAGLQPGTTYHYQWLMANPTGTSSSPDAIFTTAGPPPPVITSTLSATGTAGTPFSYQIAATNSPASYNAAGLPAGLGVNTSTGLISGTATASGSCTVTVSAISVSGTAIAPLALLIDASFNGWRNQWFNPAQLADPTISGNTAVPMGDGIPNLLKYALNLNPMINGQSGLPVGSMMTISGSDYLTLTYNQVILATDITYIPEVSGDMQSWNSGILYVVPVSITNNPDGVTQTVVVQDLTPSAPAIPRFIRLRITTP